eukprot:1117516-Prymnesium_polylepis.1
MLGCLLAGLRRRARCARGCARARSAAEDAEPVQRNLKGRHAREDRAEKNRRRFLKVVGWQERVEQIDVRGPPVDALVAQQLARLLDRRPRLLRRHEAHRR